MENNLVKNKEQFLAEQNNCGKFFDENVPEIKTVKILNKIFKILIEVK